MKTSTMKFAAFAFIASTMAVAYADSTITVDGVAQRWPWNNKVDITYTVSGGQTRSAGVYCGLDFTLTAGGQTFAIAGSSIGASAENGTHTVTWTAPKGIIDANCSMTATLFTTNVPSGNDYMIVDLDSGAVWYEGLFATQELSNERYNTDSYKEDLLVLRKIPKWADKDSLPNADSLPSDGYPTGDSVHYSANNPSMNWITALDYYIGVFPVTQNQYQKITGTNPSSSWNKKSDRPYGGTIGHRPVESVSWNTLRTAIQPNESIPVVNENTGTFFQRLDYKTGNVLKFDLPTAAMWEIAGRAGATTTYFWGDVMDTSYVVCAENSGGTTFGGGGGTVAVGSRKPNSWGLYDVNGNVYDLCLDFWCKPASSMTGRTDAFSPNMTNQNESRIGFGGATHQAESSAEYFRISNFSGSQPNTVSSGTGFRVTVVIK